MGEKESLGRVGQFWRALTAQVTAEELAFVESCLPEGARPLFLAMHKADQRHVLNVAYTALELSEGRQDIDRDFLLRCCLLHDVGRVKGTMDVWGKVWGVLAEKLLSPSLRRRLENHRAEHFWQRPGLALYVYRCHAEIGAEKLMALGLHREAGLIRLHHAPENADDPEELKILRRADALN